MIWRRRHLCERGGATARLGMPRRESSTVPPVAPPRRSQHWANAGMLFGWLSDHPDCSWLEMRPLAADPWVVILSLDDLCLGDRREIRIDVRLLSGMDLRELADRLLKRPDVVL